MRRSTVLSLAGLLAASAASLAHAGNSITLNPANNIQATINSGLYTEIVLSPGTYNQLIDFNGAALTLRSTTPDDPAVVAATVLDGSNLGGSVVVFDDAEGPDSVLLGLTITGGDASGASPNDRGGGIRCFPGSPTIDRCVVADNTAGLVGGGMYGNASAPVIIDTLFIGNTSVQGGAIYANAPDGGFEVARCRFEANTATTSGGAMRMQGGVLRVLDSEFVDNTGSVNGGGILTVNTQVFIDRTRFTGNIAELGGGIYTASEGLQSRINDSVFNANIATVTGGGTYFLTPFVVRNVTFVGNTGNVAAIEVAAGSTTVVSSILWNNDGASDLGGGGAVARYSLIQGGFPGVGNIDVDPQFLAGGDDPFVLSADSPAIDAGDTGALTDEYPVDFLGQPRALNRVETPDTGVARLGISVDLGAFEFQPESSGSNPECPADIDLSGDVDFADLLAVLSAFGGCP